MKYKPNKIDTTTKKILQVLIFNSLKSSFQSHGVLKRDSLFAISLEHKNKTGDFLNNDENFRSSMDDQYKISSDSKSDIVTFQDILGEQYLAKYEEKIKLKWQISSDTQDFNGIKCQKATTEYGGRKWITWFASEYNFHFGPYKFQGLPGLIIKIWDTENNFMWDFVGLKKQNSDNFYENTYLELQGWQIANLDKKNFLKVEHQYFNHPLGNISEIFPDASGDKIQKILEIEREKIKRNQYMNNKIEITQK